MSVADDILYAPMPADFDSLTIGDLMKRRADLIKRGAECRAQFEADLEQLRRDGRHADADTLERLIQEAFDSTGC